MTQFARGLRGFVVFLIFDVENRTQAHCLSAMYILASVMYCQLLYDLFCFHKVSILSEAGPELGITGVYCHTWLNTEHR